MVALGVYICFVARSALEGYVKHTLIFRAICIHGVFKMYDCTILLGVLALVEVESLFELHDIL